MEAQSVAALPDETGFQFEPKWDGFRALCFRDGDSVALQSKSGQPLARYFPEVTAAALAVKTPRFVLDGEIVVPVEDRLDFDQLLQRIHPAATRIAMLAKEYPAIYVVFDLLFDDRGEKLHARPLAERRPLLEKFAKKYLRDSARFKLSPATTDRATVAKWYKSVGGALDGIIAKRLDIPYSSGDRKGMMKIKRLRTADCVVGGYRTSSDGSSLGSLLLGLYTDDGDLDYVGFTSGFSAAEKQSLFKRLAAMKAGASFTSRIPGGPSRWNRGKETAWVPVRPEIVLEVEFDHVSGGRFRHGTRPLRFRPEKAPRQCTMDQLDQPVGASPFTLAVAD
ncbi:MAG: ATP-dependent DNA ligase [Candidatus Eremiobacteraeota bacterium]|nr:ATP-dependent DNA ligase [Candidatus Eremiobacteraeota bacterium]